MDLFWAISQGIGVSLATGLRPFLPPLLVGALARADLGVNFTGTDYAFLESAGFLGAMVLVAALGLVLSSRDVKQWALGLVAVLAVGLGALEFAGSLAGEGHVAWPGLVAGVICALLGFGTATLFISRAQARLASRGAAESSSFLNMYADAAALVLSALAIAIPPVSYVAAAACAWFLVERRRREGRKYEGLRVLR
jgi:hypothetical protein